MINQRHTFRSSRPTSQHDSNDLKAHTLSQQLPLLTRLCNFLQLSYNFCATFVQLLCNFFATSLQHTTQHFNKTQSQVEMLVDDVFTVPSVWVNNVCHKIEVADQGTEVARKLHRSCTEVAQGCRQLQVV